MNTFERPWGWYKVLHTGEGYLVKEICVKPKQRLSLQSHVHRTESWTIVRGIANVTVGADTLIAGANTHVLIPKTVHHRIENTSPSNDLIFVEVQLGLLLDEEDIVRYSDDYER